MPTRLRSNLRQATEMRALRSALSKLHLETHCSSCSEDTKLLVQSSGSTGQCIDGYYSDKVAPFCEKCSGNCQNCASFENCASYPGGVLLQPT